MERPAIELELGERLLHRLFQGVGQDADPLDDPLGQRVEVRDLARPDDQRVVEGVLLAWPSSRPIASPCPLFPEGNRTHILMSTNFSWRLTM